MAYAIAKEVRKAALIDYPNLNIPEPAWEEQEDEDDVRKDEGGSDGRKRAGSVDEGGGPSKRMRT